MKQNFKISYLEDEVVAHQVDDDSNGCRPRCCDFRRARCVSNKLQTAGLRSSQEGSVIVLPISSSILKIKILRLDSTTILGYPKSPSKYRSRPVV